MKTQVLGFVVADVISKTAGLVLLPILTLQLGPEKYGELGVLLAITQLLILLLSFSGNGLVPIKYSMVGKQAALESLKTFNYMTICFTAMLTVIVLIFYHSSSDFVSILLVVFTASLNALNIQIISYCRSELRYKGMSVAVFVATLVSQGVCYWHFFTLNGSLEIRLAYLMVGAFCHFLLLLYVVREEVNKLFRFNIHCIDKQRFKECFNYGRSLWLHHLSHWVRAFGDKALVALVFGALLAGHYALAVTVAFAAVMGFTVLSQALQPFFYTFIKNNGLARFIKLVLFMQPLILAVFSAYALVLNKYWPVIFSSEYELASVYFTLALVPAYLQVLYAFLSHGVFYNKKNGFISSVSFSVSTIYLICFWGIGLLGGSVEQIIYLAAICSGLMMFSNLFMLLKLVKLEEAN